MERPVQESPLVRLLLSRLLLSRLLLSRLLLSRLNRQRKYCMSMPLMAATIQVKAQRRIRIKR